MAKYNFLIVGAGLMGATCARLLTDKGYRCLVVDRNPIVGGLCATQRSKDIDVHLYGPHVFHTNNDKVWEFVNKYAHFNSYIHTPLVMDNKKVYHLPINMQTYYELYDTAFPADAYKKVYDEVKTLPGNTPTNVEELCQQNFGRKAYDVLIKPFTKKLWGKDPSALPIDIVNNLAVGYSYSSDYYGTKYQGIPDEGYTKMIENILGDDIDVLLKKDFLKDRERLSEIANVIIYTGPIDAFCNYIYGPLDWRTLKIEIHDESDNTNNMLGASVVNIPNPESDILQMVEHKWFTPNRDTDDFNNSTILSYIYTDNWDPEKIPMYPCVTEASSALFDKYKTFVTTNFPNVIFAGRFGAYQLLSMDETVEIALGLTEKL